MIKYKLIERVNPADRTKKKFYASPSSSGRVTLNRVATDISQKSSLTKGDVQSVLTNLVEQLPKYLLDGQTIKLGDLGNLRFSFSSEGVENEADFNTNKIKGMKTVFVAGKQIKDALREAKFEKEHSN